MAEIIHPQYDPLPVKTARFTTYDSRGGVNVIKSQPGIIKRVILQQLDAAPTAGDISIYDGPGTGVYANGASLLFRHSQTTAAFLPTSVELDIPFNTGLTLGVTTGMLDVAITVIYK